MIAVDEKRWAELQLRSLAHGAHEDQSAMCACGCGEPAPFAARSSRKRGISRGQRLRYRSGHNSRRTTRIRYREQDLGYGTACWVWEGPLSRKGYGHVQANRVHMGAHRYVYEYLRGPIPGGLTLDHLCRHPACVNPDHLEPVTAAENSRRARLDRMVNLQEAL